MSAYATNTAIVGTAAVQYVPISSPVANPSAYFISSVSFAFQNPTAAGFCQLGYSPSGGAAGFVPLTSFIHGTAALNAEQTFPVPVYVPSGNYIVVLIDAGVAGTQTVNVSLTGTIA